jgi:PAS domain S-box-containing protein
LEIDKSEVYQLANKESTDLTDKALGMINDVFFVLDLEGKFLRWNKRLGEVTGCVNEKIADMRLVDFLSSGDIGVVADAIDRSVESGKANFDAQVEGEDGRIIPYEFTVSVLKDSDGEPYAVAGIGRDISDYKRAEEELRDSKEELQTIYDGMGDGVMVLDIEAGTILRGNPALATMLGHSQEELVGMPVTAIHPPDELERIAQEMEIGKSGENRILDLACLRKDGSVFFADVTGMIINYKGLPCGLAIFKDVTERKKAEEELRDHREHLEELVEQRTKKLHQTLEELERSNEELGGYAHTVSHDLRNPISAISTSAGILQTLLPGDLENADEIKEIVQIIRSNTRRSMALIDDILHLAEAGQSPREFSDVSVDETVARALQEEKNELERKSIRVIVDDNLGVVRADPTQIYRLFSNLLSNAVKYGIAQRPVIEIHRVSGEEDDIVRYLVRDNGPGIPESLMPNVFKAFVKGERGGTGIGLAIVERIVSLYGGDIRFYNDGGACFEFSLKSGR